MQGACERALRAIDSWEPGSRLDSWMFRILRNLWIDELRRKKAERIADGAEVDFEAPGEDGRRTTESRLELMQVRALIAALPAAQREVLALVCIEDLSYREAAEVLQVPIGTVMSRLARARLALATATGTKIDRHHEEFLSNSEACGSYGLVHERDGPGIWPSVPR